ncbi:MAG: PAC2 family protein [Candidatus Omnitrophota bacterium]
MKTKIKIDKKLKFKNPVLIAGWPGMGNVAIRAAVYLKDKLAAQEFASFDCEGYFFPQEAFVDEGIISKPWFPKGRFYFYKDKKAVNDIIIFISEAQPGFEKGYNYAREILNLAEAFKVKKVFTFAAMPVAIDHLTAPKVLAAATEKNSATWFNSQGIQMMKAGQISGMNGLLLAVAKEKKMSGYCILGEVPLYTIQIENPKASLIVLEALSKLLKVDLDFADLKKQAKTMEEEIERLIDYLKVSGETQGPIGEEEIERIKKSLESYTKLPESAKAKIEELFEHAKKDIKKANELKIELDKWNIYKEYEDRFLDLFKQIEKKDN